MNSRSRTSKLLLALAVVASGIFVPAASATVVGHLSLANCPAGSVIATATTIDFLVPAAGLNGCSDTGGLTSITYTSGVLAPGTAGTVNDLGFPPPGSGNTDFFAFVGNPNLHFDLLSLGPGPGPGACPAFFAPPGFSCAVFAGSPFTLTTNGTGTTISLGVSGIAHDLGPTLSFWTGSFTFQINATTPAAIQAVILGGPGACGVAPAGSHSCQSTWSFEGDATALPEPMTTTTIGAGLIGLAILVKRRLQR